MKEKEKEKSAAAKEKDRGGHRDSTGAKDKAPAKEDAKKVCCQADGAHLHQDTRVSSGADKKKEEKDRPKEREREKERKKEDEERQREERPGEVCTMILYKSLMGAGWGSQIVRSWKKVSHIFCRLLLPLSIDGWVRRDAYPTRELEDESQIQPR